MLEKLRSEESNFVAKAKGVAKGKLKMVGEPDAEGEGGVGAAESEAAAAQQKRDDQAHPFLCPCCNPEVTKFDKMLMFGPGLDHI